MSRPASFTVRPCAAADSTALADLVRELADYEKLGHLARAGEGDFRAHLFGPRPAAEAVLAEVDGEAVGFALFFPTFSTFRGEPGLYLEDLFVRPAMRGIGIGKALIAAVARRAVDRGCGRLEWSVLDWNAPAVSFYRAVGAVPLDEWTVYRIDDEPLARLASLAPEEGQGDRPE
ncbi:MAG: GNAT family N-acetyltransferase [Planctomycetia bacterium]|nr:GNAT family N-acetyltransferase [Planctomycetia bacterium]